MDSQLPQVTGSHFSKTQKNECYFRHAYDSTKHPVLKLVDTEETDLTLLLTAKR